MTLNNDTAVKAANRPDGQPQIVGTPTEASLVILAQKYQLNSDELNVQNPRQKTLVFDSDRKRMSTINKNEKGQLTLYTKGALDGILAKTNSILTNGQVRDITDNDVQQIQAANESYAKQGFRALAVAYRDLSDSESQDLSKATGENTEQNLTFVGLTIMAAPPLLKSMQRWRRSTKQVFASSCLQGMDQSLESQWPSKLFWYLIRPAWSREMS